MDPPFFPCCRRCKKKTFPRAPGRWPLPWFISVARGWRTHRFQLAQPGSLTVGKRFFGPTKAWVNPLGNRRVVVIFEVKCFSRSWKVKFKSAK